MGNAESPSVLRAWQESCKSALPIVDEATGLKKFWADGKRVLDDAETEELGEDDLDTYQRWLKKKKGPKSGKQKERDYGDCCPALIHGLLCLRILGAPTVRQRSRRKRR